MKANPPERHRSMLNQEDFPFIEHRTKYHIKYVKIRQSFIKPLDSKQEKPLKRLFLGVYDYFFAKICCVSQKKAIFAP